MLTKDVSGDNMGGQNARTRYVVKCPVRSLGRSECKPCKAVSWKPVVFISITCADVLSEYQT